MSDQRPDATRAFSLLRRLAEDTKLSAEEVHELVEVINTMSGSNVIAKIDAHNARLDALIESMNVKHDALVESMNAKHDSLVKSMNARLDSQNSKYTTLITIISIVGGLVSLILAYGTFFAGL